MIQAIYGYDRDPLDCEHESDNIEEQMQKCIFQEPTKMIEELDVENAKFYVDLIVLFAFFIILRLGCYAVLRWRARVHWLADLRVAEVCFIMSTSGRSNHAGLVRVCVWACDKEQYRLMVYVVTQ